MTQGSTQADDERSGDEPVPVETAAPTEPEHDEPAADGPAPLESAVVADQVVEASVPAQVKRGVTMPVAVPVTVALVLGLAIGLILGWVIPRPGDTAAAADEDTAVVAGGDTAGEQSTTAATVLDPAAPPPVAGGPDGTEEFGGFVIGTEGPIVELFEDYVCPFCAQLEAAAGASLRESALDGEFRLVLHPIAFLTEDSPRASNASACVYQHEETDTWVAFHEGLYERQNPSESVGQYTTEILLDLADEVGAASAQTSACIEDGSFDQWVTDLTQQSFNRGVRGTPTLAVDGTLTDVAPLLQ